MGYATPELIDDIFKAHPEYKPIDTFIETGTYRAQSILNMVGLFKNLHTIELSRPLYEKAVKDHGSKPIHFHFGDSPVVLKKILSGIKESVVFYLDAHACKWGGTSHENPLPLWEELRIIADRGMKDVVVVDDLHAFGRDKHPNGEPDVCNWKDVSPESIAEFIGKNRISDCQVRRPFDCMVIYIAPK